MKKTDEEEREVLIQEHTDWKKEASQRIFVIKDDLDTVLSNPNMIA